MTWLTDVSAYRQAFIKAVANAPGALDPRFLADLSLPQAVAVHSSYFSSEIRLLVMGQKTLPHAIPLADADPVQAWGRLTGDGIAMAYAAGGPFWNAFNLFCERFGRPDNLSVAWSNVSKSQLLSNRGARGVAVHNHPNYESDAYAEWQAELFRAEMAFLRPHAVLAFVGPNQHEQLLHKQLAHCVPIGAHTVSRDEDGYRVWSCPGMPYCLVSAYHPNGYRAPVPPAEAAENATYALMRLLKQRGHTLALPALSWSQRLRDGTRDQLTSPIAPVIGTRLKHADGRFGTIVDRIESWSEAIVVEDRYSSACASFVGVEALIADGWVVDA